MRLFIYIQSTKILCKQWSAINQFDSTIIIIISSSSSSSMTYWKICLIQLCSKYI